MENNNRGSEWSKWDLHIHTTASYDYKNKSISDKCFVDILSENNIAAIAITDHHFIDVKKIKEIQRFSKEKNITVFPGIEFLSDARGKDPIHFIGIFSEKSDIDYIWKQIESKTNICKIQRDGKNVNEVYCDLIDTAKLIHELGGLVTIHAGSKTNSIDNITNALPHSEAQKNDIAECVDIFEVGKEADVEDYKKYVIPSLKKDIGKIMPIIICSDNHNINAYSAKQNCWIKADLTFEGLKQILYEPDERLRIQQDKPDEKRGYQVIDSIFLNDDTFWKGNIYLSENLNTIIGGRSTGKSTLMKAIAKKIDEKVDIDDEKKFIQNHLNDITIKWKDGEETDSRDIQFFHQSFMYEIADSAQKTDELIRQIISNKEDNKFLVEYNDINNELKKKISKSILDVFQIQSDINITQTQLKEKGDKKGVETEIERLNAKIQNLSKDSEITKEDIKEYQTSLQNIAEWEKHIRETDNDMQLFVKMKTVEIINNSYLDEYGFNDLSFSNNAESLNSYFDSLVIKTNKEWVDLVEKLEKLTLKEKTQFVMNIEQKKQTELFKKGLQYYNDNKELKDIQTKLKEESDKLQDINKLIEKLDRLNIRKNNTITLVIDTHNSYSVNAQNLVRQLTIEHDEVKITTKNNCNVKELKEFLENRLNQRGTERQSFIDNFVNQYESNLTDICGDFLSKALDDDIDYKNGYTSESVINELLTTNWFNISFELTYQNDVFSEMSQGKQAFVILKLLLEFSTKECPILIDQPEDSLDNRAIYNELVQYLRMKKTQRQIILVTHNPNVVVSADSENVIVANQTGKNSLNEGNLKFQYLNGSLENTKPKDKHNNIILESQGIREHVCEILEGGKEAFEKREKKYGFK